jgi:hypothetical protein
MFRLNSRSPRPIKNSELRSPLSRQGCHTATIPNRSLPVGPDTVQDHYEPSATATVVFLRPRRLIQFWRRAQFKRNCTFPLYPAQSDGLVGRLLVAKYNANFPPQLLIPTTCTGTHSKSAEMRAIRMRSTCRSGSRFAAKSGAAESNPRRAKHTEGRLRASAGAIAFAMAVVLALTAAGHAELLTEASRPNRPTASPLPVQEQRFPLIVHHNDSRHHHSMDSDLQQLYDVIMSRVGQSSPR